MQLSDDKKLQLINNMMVTIISERGTQPIVNTSEVK
ncbi:MAG: SPFH domain-containing protein, partial [Pediococcus sp.]|nr:SPFH domain-containing protein [Pediococcus sp.]